MKKRIIVFACLILILSILPADALDRIFETNEEKNILPAPELPEQREPVSQDLYLSAPATKMINAGKTLSDNNDLNPDYGNTVIVNIENELDLLKILNEAGEKKVDGSGKRIKNIYTLTKDMTINASDLDETYFISATRLNSVMLYDCIDGNNKTITVNVDTPGPARPLLNHINNYAATTKDDRLFIKNLKIVYDGDVKVTPFIQGYSTFCDFENITILVNGDIISDYTIGHEDDFSVAYGFAFTINSIIRKENGVPVKDAYGNDFYEPLIIQNISIQADRIGYVDGTSRLSASGMDQVLGFSYTTPNLTDVRNIQINFNEMVGKSNVMIAVCGFVYQTGGTAEEIHVTVKKNIEAETKSGADVIGIGGAAVLKNSTLNVGGDIKAIGTEKPNAINVTGFVEPYHWALRYNNGTDISNNSVTVGGNMTGESPRSAYVYGFMTYTGQVYGYVQNAADNIVTVNGNMTSKTNAGQALLAGFGAGMTEGKNNTVVVNGDMISESDSYTTYLIGHTWNTLDKGMNISDSTAEVGGVMKTVSGGNTTCLFGMILGNISVHDGNRVIVLNKKGEPAGMYSETKSTNSARNAQIHGYGIDTDGTTPVVLTNSSVYVKGDILSKAPYNAYTSGMAYGSYKAPAGTSISENIVFVDGKINSAIDDGNTGTALTSGFITYSGYGVEKNALYAKDGICAETNSGNGAVAAGFIYEPETGYGEVFENTWLDRPGKSHLNLPENKTRAGYEDFVLSTPAGAKVENNYYTSVLEGHRVSNELEFDSVNGTYMLSNLSRQPFMAISPETDYGALTDYIIEKEDVIGELNFSGPDAKEVVFKDGQLKLPENCLVMLTAYENSNMIVKDIPGIGYQHDHGNITGRLFTDDNGNGEYDKGEETANVGVKAYYAGEEVASETTDADGNYTIRIPLLSAKDPEITLKIEIPQGFNLATHANNSFGTNNENIPEVKWTVPADSGYGILEGLPFIVTFDSQGGTPVAPVGNIPPGSTITEPEAPEKEKFIFGGWYNESECLNRWDFAKDTVTENITLYAGWKNENGTEPPGGNPGSGNGTGEAVVKDPMGGEPEENKPPGGQTPEPVPEKEPEKLIILFFMLGISVFTYRNKKEKDRDDEIFK